MITKCGNADVRQILEYIGIDYSRCLYLYLNIKKYGLETNLIDAWILTDNNLIKAILLKYYSCLHVFSKDNRFNSDEIAFFFVENHFTMLYCTSETARRIYMSVPQSIKNTAVVTNGWVAKIKELDHAPYGMATHAEKEDFEQIAKLIYDDNDIGRSYKLNELTKQIIERNIDGYSRNLVIKKGNQVIAHACTNAEMDGIAVVAELVVREEYRRKGYASEIWRAICSEVLSEGKEVYSFYYSKESRTLHKHIGFYEVCEWTKVVIG